MRHINWIRVFIGGIVAGLIIDVVQWLLNGVFLGPDWRETMQALGRPIHESAGSMIFYILLGFAYGIMATWMYAAIRPRFDRVPQPLSMPDLAYGRWETFCRWRCGCPWACFRHTSWPPSW